MRVFSAALLVLALSLLVTSPAAASCAPPASVADNAARADVVVYGTVTSAGGGAVTLRVDRVLKGQVGTEIRTFVGPGRGGGGGTAVATSIDYSAAVGSDHVLYIVRAADRELETNACIGSHAGPPDAAERAHFGAATSPTGGSITPARSAAPVTVQEVPLPVAENSPILPVILGLLAAAMVLLLRRRHAA